MRKFGWLTLAILLVVAVAAVGYALLSWDIEAPPDGGPTAVAGGAAATATEPAAIESTATEPVAKQPAEEAPTGTETITILHTNDFHGAIEPKEESGGGETGGLVNLVSLIDQLRAEDPDRTLLVDSGDTFQGTYVSNSTQGEVVMAAMNVAGYDAWTLGNHEFDWGREPLRARVAQASFPVVVANLLDGDTGEVWAHVEPYTVVEVGRAKVAILGLTYPDTPTINRPQNVEGLEFREPVQTVRRYLPDLEDQADLIVVLSHAGYDNDVALARAVEGIDVIVGGHSHMFMESPQKIGDTLVVQAGAKGQVLGRLELTVDLATGQVVDYVRRHSLRQVTGDVPVVNEEVQLLVDAALAEAAETMGQSIGETAVALDREYAGEYALGNLVVDAMLAADVDGRLADIALHNNGGIREALPKGPINYGQIYAVLPFDNQLIALDLTGEQVLRILEHSVADREGALQVAGLTFQFSMSRPVGQRVLEVTVGGEPLDPERVYRVVTIDYLVAGGDGYDTFLEGANLAYGDAEVWVLAEYIRAHSPVAPQVEGRIVQR
jgi:2',3'-cyclic-nucleotide 2'-phosphodiesterase (5'-nucleotidase family)